MSSRQNKPHDSRGANPGVASVQTPTLDKVGLGKISPGLVAGIFVTLFFAIALFIRVYPPFKLVFSPEGIKFTSNDSYYFMRIVDNLIHNFPHHMEVNPYFLYPNNVLPVQVNFFVWLLAVPAWIAGLGSPSQHTIDVISVYMPAVMGALTVVPVYFIGKTLFNRWAGVFAAGLIAILPGEFLGRSILGFTDNHVAESLFTAVAMMFLVMAVKTASQRELTLAHLKKMDWSVLRRPLIFALAAGFTLGIYIYTWAGALLFVLVAFAFFVLQFIVDHLKGKSTDYLCIVGAVFFLIGLVMAASISSSLLYLASLAIALLAMPALALLSRAMARGKMPRALYAVAIVVVAAASVGLVYVANRPLFSSMVESFRLFRPSGTELTTVEMQPLISSIYGPALSDRLAIAWGNFNVSFFLSIISLFILFFLLFKEGKPEKSLLLVWSVVIILATLGQRRFGYYLAVNVALLTGYLCWKALDLAGLKEWAGSAQSARRRLSTRSRKSSGSSPILNYAVMVLAVLVIFFGVFFWNIEPAMAVASSTPYAPSDAWQSSLNWLKDNSPDPLGNPDAYYEAQKALPPGESYKYPESAYGVLSWWDYGYWIMRIAHRIPNANPSQDPVSNKEVAEFFTSQNETAAEDIRQKLGSSYFVIDHETTLSKFWAIITWAGQDTTKYFDSYLASQDGGQTYRQVILYYPEYYRSMAVRLFNFDGQAVTPDVALVISYADQRNSEGQTFKVITNVEQYATYDEATANMTARAPGNYRIVGSSPLQSPVPLEAVQHYSLAHSSDNFTISLQNGETMPSVKIFEYEK